MRSTFLKICGAFSRIYGIDLKMCGTISRMRSTSLKICGTISKIRGTVLKTRGTPVHFRPALGIKGKHPQPLCRRIAPSAHASGWDRPKIWRLPPQTPPKRRGIPKTLRHILPQPSESPMFLTDYFPRSAMRSWISLSLMPTIASPRSSLSSASILGLL